MDDELVIRQVRPVPHGRLLISPFEASEDFTQACWQSNEAIITSASDIFYSITRAGEEVVRLIVVDHPEVDTGYGIPGAGAWWDTRRSAPRGIGNIVDIEHWRVQVRLIYPLVGFPAMCVLN